MKPNQNITKIHENIQDYVRLDKMTHLGTLIVLHALLLGVYLVAQKDFSAFLVTLPTSQEVTKGER